MKTPQDNYDHIRALLSRYYDGLTSPDENRRLTDFLGSACSADLPYDLAEEAAVFAMIKRGEDELAASMPGCLEENLRAMIADHDDQVKPKRSKFIRFAVRVAASAAVAALLITVGLRSYDQSVQLVTEQQEPASLAVVLPDIDNDDAVDSGNELMAYEPVHPQTAAPAAAKPDYKEEAVDIPDNYVEITDLDQACMLAQDALALVREKLALAGYSISSASGGLRQIEYAMQDIIIN